MHWISTLPLAPWRGRASLRRWAAFWPGPEWALCVLLCGVWFGCATWLRPLAVPDEGRYVGVAWEMLKSGDWRVPTLDGMPFFHKPPLFYWITAASMSVFGPGLAAARLASWLAGVALNAGVFAFISTWVGRRQAWLSVIVLGTAPLLYGGAQYANMDMLVAACLSGAVLLLAHATLARERDRPHRPALAAAFACAALGVLSKGLIGAALPVLVLLGWGLFTRRPGRVLTLLVWGPGWLVFAVIAAPWFIAMQAHFSAFDHEFFVVQHFRRFAASGFNNVQPWWFYGAALVVLTLPWSPWLLAGWRRSAPDERAATADVRMLMRLWLATVVVFFSLPDSKLVGYILPALAPLACLIADAAARAQGGRKVGRALIATVGCAGVICVAASVYAHYHQPKSHEAIATALRTLKQPGEPVFFLDNYYYDVTFYARLEAPASVVDNWSPAEVAKDSWRRELVDAQRFAGSQAAHRLLPKRDFAAVLCASPPSWLVGPWPADAEATWLGGHPPVLASGATALWHLDTTRADLRAAWGCLAPPG